MRIFADIPFFFGNAPLVFVTDESAFADMVDHYSSVLHALYHSQNTAMCPLGLLGRRLSGHGFMLGGCWNALRIQFLCNLCARLATNHFHENTADYRSGFHVDDTVLFKDKLTVTFRVKRKEEINVLDLANFVLCAARLLSDDKPETVQVKTTLHSPGDVILQIWNFAQENAFSLLICYMAIFGGKVGDYEFHSIIGVIKGIINHKYDKDKKKIELRKLSAEADLAEQQALKQKLENIETMRRLQLSSVDAYAEPLATAAKNLAVQPSSATIIDITKILKSQQEDQPPQ